MRGNWNLRIVGLAVIAACATLRPTPIVENELGNIPGDLHSEPIFVDLDRDGTKDHVLSVVCEKSRLAYGWFMSDCERHYTVTVALTKIGSNGDNGQNWTWCASKPVSRVWVTSDGKVHVLDDQERTVP